MAWKSKGLSDESIKPLATSDNSLKPKLDYFNSPKFRVKFNGSCLTNNRVFTPDKITNLHIAFEIKSWPFYTDDGFTFRNPLFGATKLTTNPAPDKYSHSGYGISFNIRGSFSLPNGGFGKNVMILGADTSSSVRIYNIKKEILIIGEGQTQGLDDTTGTAEAEYSINFTEQGKKFCLTMHYNGSSSYLVVNGVKIYQFKAKVSGITAYRLFLGNISKDFSVNDMKEAGLNGSVYNFSVDYFSIDVGAIQDIQKHLMNKNNIN